MVTFWSLLLKMLPVAFVGPLIKEWYLLEIHIRFSGNILLSLCFVVLALNTVFR